MQKLIFSFVLPWVISGIFVCQKPTEYEKADVVENDGFCEIIKLPCSFEKTKEEVEKIYNNYF